MKKIFSLLFIFLPAALSALPKHGQALFDSLQNELVSTYKDKDDTVKVAILDVLCFGYYNIDPDKGIRYGKQGLELAEKLKWNNHIAHLHYILGANYCVKGDYPAALDSWFRALKLYEERGDKMRIGYTLNNIGRVFVMQNHAGQALNYYIKSLFVFEAIKDSAQITNTLGDMGSAYNTEKNFPMALKYYTKALESNKKLGKKDGIAENTENVDAVYEEQKDYPQALEYNYKALKMHEELGDKISISINLGNIGDCYLYIAKDTSGKKYNSPLIPAGRMAKLRKAIGYFDSCIALSKGTGSLDNIQEYSKDLAEAEELTGNYKAALEDYKLFVSTKDSVYNTDNNIKITNLEANRNMELADKQIEINRLAILKKRNERWYYISGLAAMTVFIFIIFRNYKRQQNSNKLLTKTNALLNVEKKRSDDLLLNILPAEVAEELKDKGKAEAKLFEDVTVLFTDFVNFTKVSERLTPNELVNELHTCFQGFDEITNKYKIEKIKTIGDAYLAVCGLPLTDPKHAENIVRAAIEINAFMRDRLAKLGNNTFEIRIGIHSGNVVAGIVGVKKFAYDIWGDTVNTAARMEQNSNPGRINLSETTYDLVKDKFNCEYRGEIEVKGKGGMKMYYVV